MVRRLLAPLVCAWLALAATLAVAAAPARGLPPPVASVEGITEYRLPNGLQVLLAPDDGKPTTTVNLTLRVGSRHENYGETGMAHLLEHMVFKGTPTTRNVWAEFTKRGLRANGSTWLDRTNYFASFAANDEHLRWYLAWQADALVNSFIARKDLDTEMTVVRNEMEMGENDPGGVLFEKTLATMYQWHNYGKSTIGARADVENVDTDRLRAFYRTYYQPDNATLVISGKFDPARAMAWVQQSFGKLPRPKRVLPRQYTLDPVQDGERSVTLRRAGGVPLVMAGYHMPAGPHPDFPAVELLMGVLADAPAGRLHKALVDSGRAAATFSFTKAQAEPGFAMVGAQLGAGQDTDAVARATIEVVEGLATQPVTDEEFKRAQLKWLKGWEQRFTNPEAVGVALSETVAQGDWRLFFLQRDRIQTLTLADLQRVAAAYFVPSNRTLAVYLPSDKPRRAPAPAAVDVAAQMRAFKPQPPAERVPPFDTSPAHVEASTQRFTLPGGLKAALLPKPTRGQAVQAVLRLHFGDERSLSGLASAGAMAAALLDKGSASLTRQQVQDRLDALKTELGIAGDEEGVTVSLRTRREHLPEAIRLAGTLLREPAFAQSAFDEVLRQWRASWSERRGDPEALVGMTLARAGNPYPKGDPRHARTLDEEEADAAALTLEQVRAFHQRFYGAAQGEFAAVGEFDPVAVRQALESALGGWAAREPYRRVAQPLYERRASRQAIATPDKQNAMLGVVQTLALNDSHADYPAFMLANFLLGSGGDSRLWKRIREREGLSYSVWSWVDWSSHEAHSTWHAGAIFAPANRDKVERALGEEVERALKDGFTAAEVATGRQALLARRRLSRAQDEALAGALAGNLELGRAFTVSQKTDDAIAALTAEQVNAALRRHLRPADFAIAVGGDFKQP